MTPGEAVVYILEGLATDAEQRIYQLILPQWPHPLPAIRVQQIPGDAEDYHLRGGSRSGNARIQVDCYGATFEATRDLADQVNGDDAGSGLSGWRGDIGSPSLQITGIMRLSRQDIYEPDERRYVRTSMDFRVFYFD